MLGFGKWRHTRLGASARQGGFTLVELMVTVAVLAIVAMVGVPAMGSLIAHNRLTGAANELVATMQFARSEAISRRTTVVVCPSNAAGTACSGASGTRWLVAVQPAGGGALQPLRVTEASPKLSLSVSNSVSTAGGRIEYQPNGFLRIGSRTDGALSVCDGSLTGDNAMVVALSVARIGSYRRNASAACLAPADV